MSYDPKYSLDAKIATMRTGLAVITNGLQLDVMIDAGVETCSALNDRGCGTLDTHVAWLSDVKPMNLSEVTHKFHYAYAHII